MSPIRFFELTNKIDRKKAREFHEKRVAEFNTVQDYMRKRFGRLIGFRIKRERIWWTSDGSLLFAIEVPKSMAKTELPPFMKWESRVAHIKAYQMPLDCTGGRAISPSRTKEGIKERAQWARLRVSNRDGEHLKRLGIEEMQLDKSAALEAHFPEVCHSPSSGRAILVSFSPPTKVKGFREITAGVVEKLCEQDRKHLSGNLA